MDRKIYLTLISLITLTACGSADYKIVVSDGNFNEFIFTTHGVPQGKDHFGYHHLPIKKQVWEWDYTGVNIPKDEKDGEGRAREHYPCFNFSQGCDNPLTPAEAYNRISDYYRARAGSAKNVLSGTGHHYFQHLGAKLGASVIGVEVGENINSTQAHIAFTRGAASQYNKPWGVDMSAWYGPSIRDYTGYFGDYAGADYGHSLSLFKRTYYVSYMSGANFVQAEAGNINFYLPNKELSPLGHIGKEFYKFTKKYPNIGKPFVPVAVVIDHTHGLGLGTVTNGLSWNLFPPSSNEQWAINLFNTIWPNSFAFSVMGGDESNYMVNTPYGDVVDVLTDEASEETLSKYKYVLREGDTLSPSTIANLMPFTVVGDIEYLINIVNDKEYILTLVNNKGITKYPKTAEVVTGAPKTVMIQGSVQSIQTLTGQEANGLTFDIPSGDLGIYRIILN